MINQQTASPVALHGHMIADHSNHAIVSCVSYGRDDQEAQQAHRLVVASYNAFDKLARALDVDAVELAEKLNLHTMVGCWATRDGVEYPADEIREALERVFGIKKHLEVQPL